MTSAFSRRQQAYIKVVVGRQRFPLGRVDYGAVIQWKFPVLAKAAKALLRRASERYEFDCYCDRNAHWLDGFAVFISEQAARLR